MPNSMISPTRANPAGACLQGGRESDQKPMPAGVEEEPFLIDPGSEDPGAGIDQLPPLPARENDPPAADR